MQESARKGKCKKEVRARSAQKEVHSRRHAWGRCVVQGGGATRAQTRDTPKKEAQARRQAGAGGIPAFGAGARGGRSARAHGEGARRTSNTGVTTRRVWCAARVEEWCDRRERDNVTGTQPGVTNANTWKDAQRGIGACTQCGRTAQCRSWLRVARRDMVACAGFGSWATRLKRAVLSSTTSANQVACAGFGSSAT
jgi:hypothetical protein